MRTGPDGWAIIRRYRTVALLVLCALLAFAAIDMTTAHADDRWKSCDERYEELTDPLAELPADRDVEIFQEDCPEFVPPVEDDWSAFSFAPKGYDVWAGADVREGSWLIYSGMTMAFSRTNGAAYANAVPGLRFRAETGYGQWKGNFAQSGRTRSFETGTAYATAMVGWQDNVRWFEHVAAYKTTWKAFIGG
ncbi:MAG: hypothetical protein AAFY64_04920, partial [Pseudomonadota bacterium]